MVSPLKQRAYLQPHDRSRGIGRLFPDFGHGAPHILRSDKAPPDRCSCTGVRSALLQHYSSRSLSEGTQPSALAAVDKVAHDITGSMPGLFCAWVDHSSPLAHRPGAR